MKNLIIRRVAIFGNTELETILLIRHPRKFQLLFQISNLSEIASNCQIITLIHKKKVEVIARERIQNFMLALGNLIITPQKNQNSVV